MGRTISPRTPNATWDNGIYQADERTLPALSITAEALPAYCGPMTDMGRDQRCGRTMAVYSLRSHHDGLLRERARQPRLRNDWKARNLAGWIAYAERELAQMLTWPLPECACGEHAFPEPVTDTEAALPACSC